MVDGLQLLRIYSVCSFERGLVVPRVELIDANTDEEAVKLARGRNFTARREVWHRHRFVADIPPVTQNMLPRRY